MRHYHLPPDGINLSIDAVGLKLQPLYSHPLHLTPLSRVGKKSPNQGIFYCLGSPIVWDSKAHTKVFNQPNTLDIPVGQSLMHVYEVKPLGFKIEGWEGEDGERESG